MSNIPTFTEGACPKIQDLLTDVVCNFATDKARTQNGLIQALVSDLNRCSEVLDPDKNRTGQKRDLEVLYVQRPTVYSYSEITDCASDTEPEPLTQTVTVSKFIRSQKMQFTEDKIRGLCMGQDQYVAMWIQNQINNLITGLDKAALAELEANIGQYYNSASTSANYCLINNTGNTPNYYGEASFMQAYTEIGGSGMPLLIGAGKTDLYRRMTQIGCCNEGGIDLSRAGAFAFFYDVNLAGVTGSADNFYILAPSAVQFLHWNRNRGIYQKETPSFVHTVIVDPVTGISFDLNMKYDDCDRNWVVWLETYWDMFFVPTDAFAVGDPMEGVNGTLKGVATAC